MSEGEKFYDIMTPRRTESGIFYFMTKEWHPEKTMILDKYYSPQELKDSVANSIFIDSLIEAESNRTGVSKGKLQKEIKQYLDEMGLDNKMFVIRWMGVVFLKISFMMKIGIFVNETAILKVKSTMGKNPVLFLPTHRSYADFCLMTYLCFHYNIALPAVAAGMDFYSMAIVGKSMRDTGGFFIRRTLAGAPLYAATLRQYVRTLVTRHCAPVEFFLEGTRSRSNKSMAPKYGMLSMSLVPFFAGEVSDITIVPVNISYDRLMEHGLFAYEHLGVPKPKESTGGLIKALSNLNDNFGNIYINLGDPLSVKQFINENLPRTNESLKPLDLQQMTPEQFSHTQDIANYVITLQQKCTVATISNLVALVLMNSIIKNQALVFEELLIEMEWMIAVLKNLGASVFENDVRSSVERILVVHHKMMKLDKERRLRLISSVPMNVSSEVKQKMKGHILDASTMVNAVPLIQLQLYVNPVAHYLLPPAVVCLGVSRGPVSREQLASDYRFIRALLKFEFYHLDKAEENTFNNALQFCLENEIISSSGDSYSSGGENKLHGLLKWSAWPALTTVVKCSNVLSEQKSCEHKQALKLIQQRIESSQCHPYCLSLEVIANCLQGLVLVGALQRSKSNDTIIYEVVPQALEQCNNLVNSVLPAITVDFAGGNTVIWDQHVIPSRL